LSPAFSSAVQCSLIEQQSQKNLDVDEEEGEDINDDRESSSDYDHYSCQGQKEDEEW